MPNPENLIPAQKGEVRNPNGRPKGSRNRSTIARKWLDVTVDHINPVTGEAEQMTIEDVITLAQIRKARKGDSRGYDKVMDSAYGSPDQNIKTENITKLDLSQVPTEEIERIAGLIDAIDNNTGDGIQHG